MAEKTLVQTVRQTTTGKLGLAVQLISAGVFLVPVAVAFGWITQGQAEAIAAALAGIAGVFGGASIISQRRASL